MLQISMAEFVDNLEFLFPIKEDWKGHGHYGSDGNKQRPISIGRFSRMGCRKEIMKQFFKHDVGKKGICIFQFSATFELKGPGYEMHMYI